MIANEGSTSAGRGAPKIVNGPSFNFTTWEIHLGGYLMRFPEVREALAGERSPLRKLLRRNRSESPHTNHLQTRHTPS